MSPSHRSQSQYAVAVIIALLSVAAYLLTSSFPHQTTSIDSLWSLIGLKPFKMSAKSHFRKIQSFKTDYAPCTITQYVSERSGMQVVVADRKGPKLNGYFTLATEIFDDSGAPHTLEHLVFMGSKSYQYKGLLDKLSSRAYSHTNAWTATDHTAASSNGVSGQPGGSQKNRHSTQIRRKY
jgi:hypothetical protein